MLRILPALTLLIACVGYVPPPRPSYSETCEPSHSIYFDLMTSKRDMSWSLALGSDPKVNLEFCTKAIEQRGWHIQEKKMRITAKWDHFSSTLPGELPLVVLRRGFYDKPIDKQAETMCHEFVHVLQWDRDTTSVMLPTYSISEGTLAYEIPAYSVSYIVWAKQNNPTKQKRWEYAKNKVDILYSTYSLYGVPDCLRDSLAMFIYRSDGSIP